MQPHCLAKIMTEIKEGEYFIWLHKHEWDLYVIGNITSNLVGLKCKNDMELVKCILIY